MRTFASAYGLGFLLFWERQHLWLHLPGRSTYLPSPTRWRDWTLVNGQFASDLSRGFAEELSASFSGNVFREQKSRKLVGEKGEDWTVPG